MPLMLPFTQLFPPDHRMVAGNPRACGEIGRMRFRPRSELLLCELHAHTTWSDGALALGALVDLYGGHGFDVLCVTDHLHPTPAGGAAPSGIHGGNVGAYLEEVEREATRARALYDLLLVPGLELTAHDPDPDRSAHVLAVGLHSGVSLDDGLAEGLLAARAAGAATIGAHPAGPGDDGGSSREPTRRLWRELDGLGALLDRFELVNRHQVFGWVAQTRLPAVACGDFHRLEHFFTWKTLLPCTKDERSLVDCLRSPARAYLTAFEPPGSLSHLAA